MVSALALPPDITLRSHLDMEYAYKIVVYRAPNDAEPFLTWSSVLREEALVEGAVIEHENYQLQVETVLRRAQGGEPVAGQLGEVKALLLRDYFEERRQVAEAKREARRLGWRLGVDEEGGHWQAWGAPPIGTGVVAPDLAIGATEAEAAERGLAIIRERVSSG